MPVEVKVDPAALVRFSPAGIPESVRRNLRVAIPPLVRELMSRVDDNLSALKSRTNLKTDGTMVENPTKIVGHVGVSWTGKTEANMVPQILETGAKPHVIRARNAKALSFFWDVVGGQVFFKQVNHPGFPGIRYMERAFQSMQSEIVDKVTQAVTQGARE